MQSFRIVNITAQTEKTRGHFLDLGVAYGNKNIPAGRSIVLEAKNVNLLPECVLDWQKKRWAAVEALTEEATASVVEQPANNEITPKTVSPVTEAADDDFDDVPALSEAVPAKLSGENTAPVDGSTAQMATAKITEAAAEERYSTDLSPIPGATPRNVDNTDEFTVRAPNAEMPGSVISNS